MSAPLPFWAWVIAEYWPWMLGFALLNWAVDRVNRLVCMATAAATAARAAGREGKP